MRGNLHDDGLEYSRAIPTNSGKALQNCGMVIRLVKMHNYSGMENMKLSTGILLYVIF